MRSLDMPDFKTPSFRLDGRRALVTGAGRGIGLAAATALAEAGAQVTLAARSKEEIEDAAQHIRDSGGQAEAMLLDVTDCAGTAAAIGKAEPFDILINNAGTNRPSPFVDVQIEDFDSVMALNVRAAFFTAQAVVRRIVEAGRSGSIINVSSQMGHVGGENRSVYCASKWAMEGFTRSMAIELGPHSIRCNTICPTFIETPMTKPFLESDAFRMSVLSKIKLGRLGTPEDLMGAIVFLASDASALMTGASLIIDGGWTAD
jgi:NAD(P)-dependent dehydrogenase (short-subunit alcohol dehydrogenase family)